MKEPKTKLLEEFCCSNDPTHLNEILRATPSWLLHSGIGIIVFFVFLLLAGSMLFQYPDVIEAPVVVVADIPPANLIAVSSGKVEKLLFEEGEYIKKGDLIAVAEAPLYVDDLLWLRNILFAESLINRDELNKTSTRLRQNINLGQLQSFYNEWLKAFHDLEQFENLDYHAQRLSHLQRQLEERNLLENQIKRQLETFRELFKLSEQNYLRDSKLVAQNSISPVDYEHVYSEYLSRRITMEDYQSQLINLKMQKNDIHSSIDETKIDYTQRLSDYRLRVQSTFENLRSQVLLWEKNYAFVAPISGKLVFVSIWTQNQQFTTGDLMFSIIPDGNGLFIARGSIPLNGSGKVKVGNRINIRLSNYPYQEFGVLQGEVMHVAAVPAGDHYPIQISLTDQLITSYNINLGHHVMLKGTAQIITEEISLFNRILKPLRSLRRNR